MNGMGRDAMRKSNKGTGRGWAEVDDPDSTQWTVLEGERWTVERENRQTCVVSRSFKDGKGREVMRVSKREGTERMGRSGWPDGCLPPPVGGTTIAGTSAGALTVAAGSGKGCERGGEMDGCQVGKDGPWREVGEQGGVDGRWGTMERG